MNLYPCSFVEEIKTTQNSFISMYLRNTLKTHSELGLGATLKTLKTCKHPPESYFLPFVHLDFCCCLNLMRCMALQPYSFVRLFPGLNNILTG